MKFNLQRISSKAILLILCFIFLFSGATTASANSAQTHWQGSTASGSAITDTDCPIEVKHELLTFDIDEFPMTYYESAEQSAAYKGRVTASYTFFNPADYDVTATLMFPFGKYPDYEQWYTDASGEYMRGNDTAKYDVKVNGAAVEKTLRHTLSNGIFNTATDMAKLHNGYVEGIFYTPETTVTEYTFQIKGITDGADSAYISMPLLNDGAKTKIIMSPCSGYHTDGGVRIGTWAKNNAVITVYAIGEPLAAMPVWTAYENAAEEKVIAGTAEHMPQKEQTYTYSKLAMTYYGNTANVSEIDWYNAETDNLTKNGDKNSGGFLGDISILDIRNRLMRWYEYEISVPAKSEIINDVTAPLYPSINLNYEPPIYGYTYLLSPAKTWASFGKLDIVVNTSYYMTENNLNNEFTKTDSGYSLSLSSLPDGELTFTLSKGENPKRIVNYSYLIYVLPFIIGAVVICGLIVTVLIVVKRKKSNRGKKK